MNETANDDTYPWEQQPGEDDTFFKMFTYYRDLRASRSYKQISYFFCLSERKVADIGKKWDWVRRVDLWEKYINENVRYSYLDFIKEEEEDKFRTRIILSCRIQGLLKEIIPFIENYFKLYNSREAKEKLQFINKLGRTLNQLSKMSDFSLSPRMGNLKLTRDVTIDKILSGDNPDTEQKFISKEFENINIYLEETNPVPAGDEEYYEKLEELKKSIEPDNVDIDGFLSGLRKNDKSV